MKTCLTPECGEQTGYDQKEGISYGSRGLCKKCHAVASTLIRKRHTTWEQLEQIGLAEPITTPKAAFQMAFEERKKAMLISETVVIPRKLAEFAMKLFNNSEAPLFPDDQDKVDQLRQIIYGG